MKIYKVRWFIESLLERRKCVRCGRWIFGEAESVNVFDRVVGSHRGIKCGKTCKLKEGSPEWVKKYWLSHALSVLLEPDYFGKTAYIDAWNSYEELITDQKIKDRLRETIKYLSRKYPNTWDK